MLKQNISACTFPKYPTLESCAQSVMLHVSTWLGITKRKLLSIHLKELNIVSQYKILRYFQPQYYSMVWCITFKDPSYTQYVTVHYLHV